MTGGPGQETGAPMRVGEEMNSGFAVANDIGPDVQKIMRGNGPKQPGRPSPAQARLEPCHAEGHERDEGTAFV